MDTNRLQTLDRGMLALQIVAQAPRGISVADLARELDVARAAAYRIVATLEDHAMLHRDGTGRIRLGSGTLVLAAQFDTGLRGIARPIVEKLAAKTQATAFVSVAHGRQCTAILTVESDRPFINIAYRAGVRHPLDRGAAGIAILAGRPEAAEDSDEIREARRLGYSLTRGQLQPGAVGVSSPVPLSPDLHPGLECSIGVVAMEDLDVANAAQAAMRAAGELAALMGHGLRR
ncbi:IclR family transcriptional regulator [Sulfitobacter aestuarii]|uniref:IclR family transcriptional regulator n=1 Tax=Sulfitobacter aestuarii TaxID=2161676 RepID=A0ABW5U4A2_9RHOB